MKRKTINKAIYNLALTAAIFTFGFFASTGCNGQIVVKDHPSIPDIAEPEINEDIDQNTAPVNITLSAPSREEIHAVIADNNPIGIVPGMAFNEVTIPPCTDQNGNLVTEDIDYQVTNLPEGFIFINNTRIISLTERDTVPDTLKELVTTTYACETNSGLKAEQEFELNDLDEGGVTDFYEFLNSEVPLLNQNGYFQLNLYSAPLYRVLFNNIWGIETGITIQSAGLDPQNPDDDRADFDDDLITNADEIKNQTNIFIATGNDISFATRNVTSIDSALVAFATADFNEDGFLDLAILCYSRSKISIYLGGGEEPFFKLAYSIDSDVSPDAQPQDIVTADFNGDGHMDLAVSNHGRNSISILLGNGNGNFDYTETSPIASPEGPCLIAAADFDANGTTDLVVTAAGTWLEPNNAVLLLSGNGDGSFSSRIIITPELSPYGITVADFNNAGQIDFAVTNRGDRWSGNTITVFLADNNNFVPSPSIVVGSNPASILAAMFVPLFVE